MVVDLDAEQAYARALLILITGEDDPRGLSPT